MSNPALCVGKRPDGVKLQGDGACPGADPGNSSLPQDYYTFNVFLYFYWVTYLLIFYC
jgi:hypothetical protein